MWGIVLFVHRFTRASNRIKRNVPRTFFIINIHFFGVVMEKIILIMRHKAFISLLLFLIGSFIINAVAQEKTFRFLNLQLTIPASSVIYGLEENTDGLEKECSFIVSVVFQDGSEERIGINAGSVSILDGLTNGKRVFSGEDMEGLSAMFMLGYGLSPVYSHISDPKGVSDTNYTIQDFNGRYYRDKRTSDSVYYENFKGRLYLRIFGDYYVVFSMQVPATNNFATLQKIANSLAYAN